MTLTQGILEAAKVLVVFTTVMMTVPYWAYVERRGVSFIQDRVGPDRCGPFGLLQPFADALKLLFKEDILPRDVDKFLYHLAPMIMVCVPLLVFAVIPFGSSIQTADFTFRLQIVDLDVGILWVLAILTIGGLGVAFAGWSSNNKYSVLSALRAAAQSISYEMALGLVVIAIIMTTDVPGQSSTAMSSIVESQTGAYLGIIPKWNIFCQPVAFLIFLAVMFAETNRTPFDFVECEQELVAGFMTEYGSMKFSMLFMGEYMAMTVMSALCVTLFLGGWSLPWVDLGTGTVFAAVVSVLVFLVKWAFVAWLYVWVRWTLPRLRFDKLMMLGWKGLIPLALANIVVTGFVGVWLHSR
jgi:NADH-quinone oxidoreductase subunit H